MQALLKQLYELNIKLTVDENGRLNIQAPQDALSPTLRAALAQHKEALIDCLRQTGPEGQANALISPQPSARFEPFELTDVQHAYWFGRGQLVDFGGVATHFYAEHDSHGLDLMRLQTSLNRLIVRHDMLRAIILDSGLQQVLPTVEPYRIDTLDVRGLSAHKQEETMLQLRSRMSHQVLPTHRAPIFDIRAVRLTDTHMRLYLSWDLLVVDASSIGLLLMEWHRFYDDPVWSPEPLVLSFRDYVLAQKNARSDRAYQRAKAYWLARIDTLPAAPDLPRVRQAPSMQPLRFARQRATLAKPLWGALKQKAKAMGCTPSTLLITAFCAVLGRWSQQPHFTLNLTLFSREKCHPQVGALVGDFTSLSLLEIDQRQPMALIDQIKRVQQQLALDLNHAAYSAVQVLRERSTRLGLGLQATMPVVFTGTLGFGDQDGNMFGEGFIGPVVHGVSQTPQVWLDHQVSEQQGALVFNWDAVQGLFELGVLEAMFGAYQTLLVALAQDDNLWWSHSVVNFPPR
jgi:pyochelin synthetase